MREKGTQLFRYKGVLAVKGYDTKWIFQVGQRERERAGMNDAGRGRGVVRVGQREGMHDDGVGPPPGGSESIEGMHDEGWGLLLNGLLWVATEGRAASPLSCV